MDYLDPQKRRTHRTRLLIGYGLTALVVALGTVILVYDAYGYGITRGGNIIQNGLLFVDSRPSGAKIYLNGKYQDSQTSSRLIMPASAYQLTLKKDGYRDWSRRFNLAEHSISRYVYPLLVPSQLKPQVEKKYSGSPGLVTQTPSRQFLLVGQPRAANGGFIFDEFDLGDLKKEPTPRVLPNNLLTADKQGGDQLVDIEWSTDNRHVLLRHDFLGGNEFIVFDRSDPPSSFNINQMFKLSPTLVNLRNKKIDQVYIYLSSGGSLQVGDTRDGQLAKPFLQGVLAYKPFGSSLLSYITAEDAPAGQLIGRIWENGQDYKLNQFPRGELYLLDAAQFQGHWYYLAGSSGSNRVAIYKDPLNYLKDPTVEVAAPLAALRISGGQKASFSTNTRFIGIQASDRMAVYDLENKDTYAYQTKSSMAGLVRWMDGHRLLGLSGGTSAIYDYDGTNFQTLVPTTMPSSAFFDRNYERFLSLGMPGPDGTVELQATYMLAGSDLPK
ncbi:hypothetical protein A3F38_02750 [Candidatus Saccharibacteria bacterium RIFCSPHIGHO2_12_FULL_48_21]|nr:MAG: hypothetical protein A3F38_02750 [Candidatus Saccharibacteria bacterium RIFCSPHIGHO2_12_FULL_48_21]